MTFAEPTIHNAGGRNPYVTHGTDAGLFVEFHQEAVHAPYESEMAGHPVYKTVDYVTIMFPGDATKKVVRPVKLESTPNTPSDPERWPNQWRRYKASQEQVHDGIPLEQWPSMTKADVLTYKAMNIHTVEQLAEISDGNLDGLGLGARGFRDKARLYMEHARGNGAITALQQENADLRGELEALKQQMAELGSRRRRNTEAA